MGNFTTCCVANFAEEDDVISALQAVDHFRKVPPRDLILTKPETDNLDHTIVHVQIANSDVPPVDVAFHQTEFSGCHPLLVSFRTDFSQSVLQSSISMPVLCRVIGQYVCAGDPCVGRRGALGGVSSPRSIMSPKSKKKNVAPEETLPDAVGDATERTGGVWGIRLSVLKRVCRCFTGQVLSWYGAEWCTCHHH